MEDTHHTGHSNSKHDSIMDRANSLSSDILISRPSLSPAPPHEPPGAAARRALRATSWGELKGLISLAFPLVLQNTFGCAMHRGRGAGVTTEGATGSLRVLHCLGRGGTRV